MAKCAAVPADPAANDLAGLNPKTDSFDVGGGGIGLFEDPLVEPLITAFLRHFLLDHRTDAFAPVIARFESSMFRQDFAYVLGRVLWVPLVKFSQER